MFPTLNLDTLVEDINAAIVKENTHEIGKVIMLTFNEINEARVVIENGRPKFAETLQDKIQMYLQVLLRTEQGKYPVYAGTNFGMNYFKFRGKKLPESIIVSEIKREITENLKKISLFDSVENFTAVLTLTNLEIGFNLILSDGTTLTITFVGGENI